MFAVDGGVILVYTKHFLCISKIKLDILIAKRSACFLQYVIIERLLESDYWSVHHTQHIMKRIDNGGL